MIHAIISIVNFSVFIEANFAIISNEISYNENMSIFCSKLLIGSVP